MLLPPTLRHFVSGKGVLQPPELLRGIPTEGVDCTLGHKQLPILNHHPAGISEQEVVFRFAPQHFDGVGIAVEQELDELVEGIDRGVCLNMNDLLEIGKAEKIRGSV